MLEIREARLSDLPALAAILAQHEGRDPRDEAERFARDDLTLVAVLEGEVVDSACRADRRPDRAGLAPDGDRRPAGVSPARHRC